MAERDPRGAPRCEDGAAAFSPAERSRATLAALCRESERPQHPLRARRRGPIAAMADDERAAKRGRVSEDRLEVTDLVACLGDRSRTVAAACTSIAQAAETLDPRVAAAVADADAETRARFDAVGHALLKCGTMLPYKAGIYGTLAALLSSGAGDGPPALARRLGAAVLHDLAAALREGAAARARRALRFLAELAAAGAVAPKSLAAVLCVLLAAAAEELSRPSRGANNVHARGEFLADVALSALPWAGGGLARDAPEALEEVLDGVRAVRDAWRPNRWRAIAIGDSGLASEAFAELLSAVEDVWEARWAVPPAARPVYHEHFAEQLVGAPRVELEPFSLPAHSKLTRYAPPRFRLCLLSSPEERAHVKEEEAMDEDGRGEDGHGEKMEAEPALEDRDVAEREKADGAHGAETDANGGANGSSGAVGDGSEGKTGADVASAKKEDEVVVDGEKSGADMPTGASTKADQLPVERYMLRQYVTDVLDNFVTDHVKGAERLLTVPMLVGANDVIVETLFSEMCATPTPTNPAIYYGSLFVDLCKVKDSRLPIKLLAAVEKMFQDAGSLEEEAFDRLTEWFSFHLSNFGYKWNWADWAVYADADMVDKFPFRALFCRDVLDRAVRLSYRDRILKIVPEDMAFFLPPPIGSGNTVRFSGSVEKEMNAQLLAIVAGAGKQPPNVVHERLLDLVPSMSFDGDEKKANLARLVALMRAILQGSARTLSHFDTLVERYMPLLHSLSSSGGTVARQAITFESGCFWSESHLRTLYVLDKLSTYRVIDGLAIVDYLFSDKGVDEKGGTIVLSHMKLCARLEQSPVWELVRLVYSRARSRLEGARAELTFASASASHATEGDAENVEDRLNKAKSSAQSAKAELTQLVLLGLRRLFLLGDVIFTSLLENGEEHEAEGVSPTNGAVFTWRVLGMIREIGRKHPDQVESVLDSVREETEDARDRHYSLKEAFEVLEEIAGCDIAC